MSAVAADPLRVLLDGVYRCGAEGVPEFVEVGSRSRTRAS